MADFTYTNKSNFLQGWKRFFCNKKKQNKLSFPFPENKYYDSGEIAFLIQNNTSKDFFTQMIISSSMLAKSKHMDNSFNNQNIYPSVSWDNGSITVNIGEKSYPDSPDSQADLLIQLQIHGYNIPEKYRQLIRDHQGRNLAHHYYKDTSNRIYNITSYNHSGNLECTIFEFKENLLSYKSFIQLSNFQSSISQGKLKEITDISENPFINRIKSYETTSESYRQLEEKAKNNGIINGTISIGSVRIKQNGSIVFPFAWSLQEECIILNVNGDHLNYSPTIKITSKNIGNYEKVINYISSTLDHLVLERNIVSLIKIFGKSFDDQMVLDWFLHGFMKKDGILIDRLITSEKGSWIALNHDSLDAVKLSDKENEELLQNIALKGCYILKEYAEDTKIGNQTDRINHSFLYHFHKISNGKTVFDNWNCILTYLHQPFSFDNFKTFSPLLSNPDALACTDFSKDQPLSNVISTLYTESTKNHKIPNAIAISSGRWHSQKIIQNEAYKRFSDLLLYKLKQQIENQKRLPIPWFNKYSGLPQNMDGEIFTGINGIMLGFWMEKVNFSVPVFLTEKEIADNSLQIKNGASSLLILTDDSVIRVFNISETTFPEKNERIYKSIETNIGNRHRDIPAKVGNLLSMQNNMAVVSSDTEPDFPRYDHVNKTLYIAPKDKFDDIDDYYRDLSIVLLDSVRDIDFEHINISNYIIEELVSRLGSAIISQSCRFNSTNSEYYHIWKTALENNPDFIRYILQKCSSASEKVLEA